ncbi:MAG: ATP-binding cassette domain-containing protein, partial [Verrucomicrobia bacterium]|nr:ATP-binding cassette domain-containing protein [Verrucomicrobiota bacterium]
MLETRDLHKAYQTGDAKVEALRGITLKILPGEIVAITGPSGCGKSTLLHILGALDTPSSGQAYIDGLPLHSMNDDALTSLRQLKIGFVFQFFHLLPTLTVEENVLLPLLLSGRADALGKSRARELLEAVGLSNRSHHRPHQLSGGQLQRAALARALVHRPSVLLADEPTGNLDSASSAAVVDLITILARREKTTVVLVTHSEEVANGKKPPSFSSPTARRWPRPLTDGSASSTVASSPDPLNWSPSLRVFLAHGGRDFLAHKTLTLLNIAALAVGVGAIVAIQTVNETALRSFHASLDLVAGRPDFTVEGQGFRIPETLLPIVRADPAVREATPVLQVVASLPAHPGEFLHL